eukprot:404860_1
MLLVTLILLTMPIITTSNKVLASDNACFNAVDRTQSTKFDAPRSSVPLIGVELVYKSGFVNCDYNNYADSYWGCAWTSQNNPFMVFLEKVTYPDSDSFEGEKYYPTTDTDGVTDIHQIGDASNYWYWYDMSSYTINSPYIALINPTYEPRGTNEFMLQYGEASGQSNVENTGTVCAEVYFIYEEDAVCISGSDTLDGKYFKISRSSHSSEYYSESVDKYIYYEDGLCAMTMPPQCTWWYHIADEVDGDTNLATCRTHSLDGCSWDINPTMTSAYCQDICISGNYYESMDGTYIWMHYNSTTKSSVYYCDLC